LGISYENGEEFVNRIENLARLNPSNDFIQQLKLRTKEKKIARHEKERRTRKTAADQARSSISHHVEGERFSPETKASLSDDEDSDDENTPILSLLELETAKMKISDIAEEKIRIFAEQYRMNHGIYIYIYIYIYVYT
jgi:hypothetical protein